MNYYEPKYLRGVLEKSLPVRMFFRTRFFNESITFPTETVSFEFAQDKRRLLPFSDNHMGSVPVERSGYQVYVFHPPLISGSRTITNDTLNMKLLGESEWNSGISPDERARELALRDLNQLQTALFRREEYMCAKVKQDGKLEIDGAGIRGEVDYGFKNISDESTSQWTDSYDIFGKLQEKAEVLMEAGITPDMLILGRKAAQALLKNKDFVKLRRDGLINFEARDELNGAGANYMCTMLLPGLFLNVFQYLEMYYDDEQGKNVPLIDDGTAILQSSEEHNMMLYGAVTYIGENEEYETAMGRYVPYVDVKRDPAVRKLIVSSRALPMPTDTESWYVMKNCA